MIAIGSVDVGQAVTNSLISGGILLAGLAGLSKVIWKGVRADLEKLVDDKIAPVRNNAESTKLTLERLLGQQEGRATALREVMNNANISE